MLHHPGVLFRNQISAVFPGSFKKLQPLRQKCIRPDSVLAAAHNGKGIPIVLAIGSAADVLHFVKGIPFQFYNCLNIFLVLFQ